MNALTPWAGEGDAEAAVRAAADADLPVLEREHRKVSDRGLVKAADEVAELAGPVDAVVPG
ncbi:hypothetical protein ON062_02260 [Microbacterium sp. C7(2022)]|nr:hypothetical protein [Microbacterium sp. C7(2022)]